MRQWIFTAILFVLVSLSACGGMPSEPRVSVEDTWARPPVTEGGNGAIYFRLVNEGGEADTLLNVSSPVATAELHQTIMKENGVMGMEPLVSVEISAGETVEFKQGGMHVMLIGVDQPMEVNETVSFTLQFKHSGDIQVTAEVRQQ